MLARNLLYTGVTPGKRLVVLVGQKRATAIAVRGGQMKRRWTKLREWLSGLKGSLGYPRQGWGSLPGGRLGGRFPSAGRACMVMPGEKRKGTMAGHPCFTWDAGWF